MLIKYYQLESRSWRQVNELEQKVKRMQLVHQAPSEDGVNVVDKKEPPLELLYYAAQEIQQRKTSFWLGQTEYERVRVQVLVKGEESRLSEWDAHVLGTSIKLEEASVVSSAAVSFDTRTYPNEPLEKFQDAFLRFIKDQYQGVRSDLRVYHDKERIRCCGLLDGPVEEILPVWKLLTGEGYGIKLETKDIVFSNKRKEFPGVVIVPEED